MRRQSNVTLLMGLLTLSATSVCALPTGDSPESRARQLAELTASDGAAGDQFGNSVALSGNTIVVGSPYHSQGAGAAYVFVKPAAGWGNMTEVAKLTASDPAPSAYFGISVAISGNTIVVGQPNTTVGSNGGQGTVYVFEMPSGGWADMTPTAELTASDGAPGDYLGWSVAISGGAIVASATGASQVGAAYVFVKPSKGWTNGYQRAKLTASDALPGDDWGWSVAVSGGTAIVGAPAGTVGTHSGAAYAFARPSTGWANMTQTAKLTASDGSGDDLLGNSVSVAGSTAVVGAPNTWHGGNADVFVEPAGGWTDMAQTAELTATGGAPPSALGASVSISGNKVAAGAVDQTVGAKLNEGDGYVFSMPASGWANMTAAPTLFASNGAANCHFGGTISISGSLVVVGASSSTVNGNAQQGAAYLLHQ